MPNTTVMAAISIAAAEAHQGLTAQRYEAFRNQLPEEDVDNHCGRPCMGLHQPTGLPVVANYAMADTIAALSSAAYAALKADYAQQGFTLSCEITLTAALTDDALRYSRGYKGGEGPGIFITRASCEVMVNITVADAAQAAA
ncbi:MAG: hypothetical protein WAX89_06645 [Alphaproteobacteria bacterium]